MPLTASRFIRPSASQVAPRVAISRRDGQRCIVALQAIEPGEWLMTIDGQVVSTPCRYSVQIGAAEHIAPPEDVAAEDESHRYLWRFLNHSCRPNAAMVRRVLVAIRPIAKGEEISFDYNTTEYDMAEPFRCGCGHCGGATIGGARHLGAEERRQRAHLMAEHLRENVGHE